MTPGDESIALLPAVRQAAMIRARDISSRELLELYLRRIDRINPTINAVVTIDAGPALDAAARADELLVGAAGGAAGAPGPLHGLPITVKDAIEVGGMLSTGGATELALHIPAADAPAVARLRRAGAIVFGKTNAPRWSGDIQTFNDLFGVTSNPWDQTVTSGGSSGGAAAAVAAGLTSFELGTDIGGSVRIPSSFCGVCGHKPSYGIVSQRGYLDRVGGGVTDVDINVFGPIARSVDDLDLLLGVLAGPDAELAPAWRLSLPPPRHARLADYRVGLWLDDPACEVQAEAVSVLRSAASALAAAGATVTEAHPPLVLAEAAELFGALLLPAVSTGIDGERGQALGGNHRTWLERDEQRTLMRRVWAKWFEDYDVLLCPVMPMLPFPHDHHGTISDRSVVINGKTRPQGKTFAWTGLVGVAYLPSTSVPVGSVGGLPVGVQVVGPYLEDRTSLFVGARLAELVGGYRPPPLA